MWDFELAVSDAAKGALRQVSRTVGPLDQKLQLLEKRITVDGMAGTYLFSVAADRQDLIDTVDSFNVTLSWSLGVLWVGLVLAVFIQVRFGLLPLQRMRQSLADIREGRAERLTGSFPKEVRFTCGRAQWAPRSYNRRAGAGAFACREPRPCSEDALGSSRK